MGDQPHDSRNAGQPAAAEGRPEQAFIRRFAFIAAGAAVVFSALGVAGWILSRSLPGWAHPNLVSLPPVSAVGLTLLSGCLFRRLRRREWDRSSHRETGVVLVVTVAGLLGLVSHIWPAPAEAGLAGWLWMMGGPDSPQLQFGTSLLLALSGLGVVISGGASKWLRSAAGVLGAGVASAGLLAIVGFCHGVHPAEKGGAALISGPAAVVFALLGVAVMMLAGPDHWLVRSWTGASVRARLLRTFVPLTAATVMISDVLMTWSQGRARVDVALVTACASLVFTGVTMIMAVKASQTLGREIEGAERRLQEAKDELETRVTERTAELRQANTQLEAELGTRQHMEEMLQSFSRRLMEAQESERRNLARELHDEIGQVLTAVKVNLQVIQRGPADFQASHLDESIKVVERAMKQVRDLSLDLRPSVLDDFGLVPALEWFLERVGQRAGWKTTLVTEPKEMRPPALIETACFRVAQAALTNTLRHASATHVRVEIREQARQLDLTIQDDGAGFDVPAALERTRRGASLGLLSMQERAWLVGGRIDINSQPGQGAIIHVVFPLEKPRSDAPPGPRTSPLL